MEAPGAITVAPPRAGTRTSSKEVRRSVSTLRMRRPVNRRAPEGGVFPALFGIFQGRIFRFGRLWYA